MAAKGVVVYDNWLKVIHDMGESKPNLAKDLAFRILDCGYTGEMDTIGVDGLEADWLMQIGKAMKEARFNYDKSQKNGNKGGRPKLDIEDAVQEFLDRGETVGTKIATQLNVHKDTVYRTQAWINFKNGKNQQQREVSYDF